MTQLDPLQTNELKIGQKAFLNATRHGSVGIQPECNSLNPDIIELVDSKFAYDKPLVKGQTGGDRGKVTYYFEARQAGEGSIKLERFFRGKLEQETLIKVLVK
ncbi:MAG: hypothetical protein H6581_24950 [Bacteroidia bacterium]|nr:hypothetical protein [Bacteroidia bacterium]